MVSRHWPTYFAIAGLLSVALACLMALSTAPAEAPANAGLPAVQSQVTTGPPASDPHDPVEAVGAPASRALSSGG